MTKKQSICKFCKNCFQSVRKLNQHIKTCPDKPQPKMSKEKCQFCQKMITKKGMKLHIRQIHPQIDPNQEIVRLHKLSNLSRRVRPQKLCYHCGQITLAKNMSSHFKSCHPELNISDNSTKFFYQRIVPILAKANGQKTPFVEKYLKHVDNKIEGTHGTPLQFPGPYFQGIIFAAIKSVQNVLGSVRGDQLLSLVQKFVDFTIYCHFQCAYYHQKDNQINRQFIDNLVSYGYLTKTHQYSTPFKTYIAKRGIKLQSVDKKKQKPTHKLWQYVESHHPSTPVYLIKKKIRKLKKQFFKCQRKQIVVFNPSTQQQQRKFAVFNEKQEYQKWKQNGGEDYYQPFNAFRYAQQSEDSFNVYGDPYYPQSQSQPPQSCRQKQNYSQDQSESVPEYLTMNKGPYSENLCYTKGPHAAFMELEVIKMMGLSQYCMAVEEFLQSQRWKIFQKKLKAEKQKLVEAKWKRYYFEKNGCEPQVSYVKRTDPKQRKNGKFVSKKERKEEEEQVSESESYISTDRRWVGLKSDSSSSEKEDSPHSDDNPWQGFNVPYWRNKKLV